MTPGEIREDLLAGTEIGARRAKAPPLSDAEIDHLLDIFSTESKFSAVDMGDEVCLSFDGSGNLDSGTRVDELYSYQSHRGADMLELFSIDYSYKAIKTILSYETQAMKVAQLNLIAPTQYGAMPDLGRYSMPDGPIPNWSELMPLGKIAEARDAQVAAIDHAVRDMVFVAEGMWEAGADGMDFDTAGAAGDGDFLATLTATETIKGRYPDIGIELGMASECVLGMHGELTYKGSPARRHVAQGAARGRPAGRRHHVRTGRQRQHDEVDRLERRPGVHDHQALHGGRRDPRAPQRGHGRRRRADEPLSPRRRGLACLPRAGRRPQVRRVVGGRG